MKSSREVIEIAHGNSSKQVLSAFFDALKNIAHKWLAIFIFLIIWELLCLTGFFNPNFISSPIEVALTMWDLTLNGILIVSTLFTITRIFFALGVALLVAIPLGFLLGGFFKGFEKPIIPLILFFAQINALTLFHFFILLGGLGEIPTILTIAWAAQWPILFNTISGTKDVSPSFIKIARSVGLEKLDIFWKVQVPASLPTIFSGIRLAVILAFLALMGVEMMGMSSGNGLGYFIIQAEMQGIVPRMWAGVVTMTLLAIALNYAVLRIENHLTKWKTD
ncbi:MAG: ABC transporter permease [Ignavibacteria bacterium]|nr:ABC transporter permease [Ignavibacteria bacterium]